MFDRWYPDRSSARQALLTKVAVDHRLHEDQIAAWVVAHMPEMYRERSCPARDLYTEIRRARGYAFAYGIALLPINEND